MAPWIARLSTEETKSLRPDLSVLNVEVVERRGRNSTPLSRESQKEIICTDGPRPKPFGFLNGKFEAAQCIYGEPIVINNGRFPQLRHHNCDFLIDHAVVQPPVIQDRFC